MRVFHWFANLPNFNYLKLVATATDIGCLMWLASQDKRKPGLVHLGSVRWSVCPLGLNVPKLLSLRCSHDFAYHFGNVTWFDSLFSINLILSFHRNLWNGISPLLSRQKGKKYFVWLFQIISNQLFLRWLFRWNKWSSVICCSD